MQTDGGPGDAAGGDDRERAGEGAGGRGGRAEGGPAAGHLRHPPGGWSEAPPTGWRVPDHAGGAPAAGPGSGWRAPGPPPGWGPDPGARTPGHGRRRKVVGAILAAFAVVAIAAAFVQLPYVIVSPGDATPVGEVVTIKGARTYPHKGALLFLTVSVTTDRPNVYETVAGWLSPNDDVLDESDVLQGSSRKEERLIDVADMDLSQQLATKVALERLGYDVELRPGVAVLAVEPGGPTGDVLEGHDVITEVDGRAVSDPESLGRAVRARRPGSPVRLTVERDGRTRRLDVKTGRNDEGQAKIGVVVGPHFAFPLDIRINPGAVGGPSAGLAFTLAIIDQLTPGSLTGGREVAITGQIGPNGEVVEIGGARQKAVAARRAHAALMIVPEGDLADARKGAGDMRVVGVSTLDEALRVLRSIGGAPVPEAVPGREPAAA